MAAKVVVELTKGEVLKAGVLLHPAIVTLDDINGMYYEYKSHCNVSL